MKIANKGKPATVDLGSDVCSHSLLLGANDSVPELFLDTRFAIPELYLGVPNLARDSPKSRLGLTQIPSMVLPNSRSWSYPNPDRLSPNSRLTPRNSGKVPIRK